jgi:hypothetical protein
VYSDNFAKVHNFIQTTKKVLRKKIKMLFLFGSLPKFKYFCIREHHLILNMKASEQTSQQIQRAINKIAQKFPSTDEPSVITDIHLRAIQDSGELLAFDDD